MRAAVDTGALLALASSRDKYHDRAVRTAKSFLKSGGRWEGTTLVLAELHGHLLRWRGPEVERETIRSLLADPAFTWHDASVDLIASGTLVPSFHENLIRPRRHELGKRVAHRTFPEDLSGVGDPWDLVSYRGFYHVL